MAPRQKPHRSKQDYSTPKGFLDAVKQRLHIKAFTFDFAADAFNHKADNYWSPANDSLSLAPWRWAKATDSGWGWLNPPFTAIGPWAEACANCRAEGGSVAFLVPLSSSNWFRDYIHGRALVLALNGRLAFIEHQPHALYPKDCMLCLFSPLVAPGFDVWTWRK